MHGTNSRKEGMRKSLASHNGFEFSSSSRRWEDGLSPERAALEATEQSLREKETQAIHLERLLQDARTENEALRASQSAEDVEALRSEVDRLNSLASEQDDVIAELEVRLDEVVDALERR